MRKLRTSGRRFLLVGVSVGLVLLLGGMAAWGQLATARTVSTVHRDDRIAQQATFAGLTDQYFQFTFLATQNAANAVTWSLTPGSLTDRRALEHLVTNSPLTSFGAALVSLSGSPLTAYPSVASLPAPSDPGFVPMRRSLLAGQPGLSAVMTAHGTPVIAFAVPVFRGRLLAGLLVTFANARTWPLQGYEAKLHIGPATQSYVLDRNGVVAASGTASVIGHVLGGFPPVVQSGATGLNNVRLGGHAAVVSYGPAGHGWTTLTVQSSSAFSGGLRASQRREELVLVVLLTFVVLLLVVFHYKRQQLLGRLAEERLYDPLTGLAQRRLFDIRMNGSFGRHRRSGAPLALLYCDLDGFKAVNDLNGHNVGDRLLVAVAERLRASVRDDDFVARLGGDEFAIVLDATDVTALGDVVARIQHELRVPLMVNGCELTPGMSIGGAVLRDPSRADDLLHEADLAMYQAKSTGRGYAVVVLDTKTSPRSTVAIPARRVPESPSVTIEL